MQTLIAIEWPMRKGFASQRCYLTASAYEMSIEIGSLKAWTTALGLKCKWTTDYWLSSASPTGSETLKPSAIDFV